MGWSQHPTLPLMAARLVPGCEEDHGQAHVLCAHIHLSYTDSLAYVEWARLKAYMLPDTDTALYRSLRFPSLKQKVKGGKQLVPEAFLYSVTR